MIDVGILTALLAGLASFLSPCVLPLVPGYLSYISGSSIDELIKSEMVDTKKVFLKALLFVLGFSFIFVAMGTTATALGGLIKEKFFIFNKIAGLLIIIFGIHMTGIFRLKFLMAEKRYHGPISGGYIGAVLLGMAFAFGWVPCVGPILFAILALASTQETQSRGMILLSVYSLGLGLPFLLAGVGMGKFIKFLDRFSKYLKYVEIISGLFLIAIGLMVMTGYIQKLSAIIPDSWILFG